MSDTETLSPSNSPVEYEISLLDMAVILAENGRILIGAPLLAGLVALAYCLIIPPTFTAVTRILPPQQQQSSASALASQLSSLAGLAGSLTGLKNPADQYGALIKSWSVEDGIIERFKLKELYDEQYIEDARKALEKNTKVLAGTKDGIISIEVDDKDPARAAAIANAYVEELQKMTAKLAITEAAQRRLFFETQVEQAKNNLTKAEIALSGSGIGVGELRASPGAAVAEVAGLKARVTAQEVRLSVMRSYSTDANPQFRQVQEELAALRAQLDKAQLGQGKQTNGRNPEYITKYRDFKYYEMLFELKRCKLR